MADVNKDKNGIFKSKTGLILTWTVGGVAVGITVVCLPFISPAFRRVCLPYVPATTQQVKNVLEALKGRSGNLVDLGSGDGRIVLSTAKSGFPSVGVELNPWLVAYSKLDSLIKNIDNVKFYRQDLFLFNLKPFKNVVIFGVEEMMKELDQKFEEELERDSYIVVCRFPLPCREPIKTIGTGVDTVWVYQKR